MIALTSISPTHINKDIQKKAVKSWLDLGMRVVSMNSELEVISLMEFYPEVEFITTDRTMEHLFGKPYVMISAMIDWCKSQDESHFCLINSDIELRMDAETLSRLQDRMKTAVWMANRVNYREGYTGTQYLDGIDVFFLHKRFLSIYNQSLYCIGQCFWDYWIPYKAIMNRLPVKFIKQDVAFHKEHTIQYNSDMWKKSGRYFLWENDLYQFSDTQGIAQMSKFVYNFIYNGSRREEV